MGASAAIPRGYRHSGRVFGSVLALAIAFGAQIFYRVVCWLPPAAIGNSRVIVRASAFEFELVTFFVFLLSGSGERGRTSGRHADGMVHRLGKAWSSWVWRSSSSEEPCLGRGSVIPGTLMVP